MPNLKQSDQYLTKFPEGEKYLGLENVSGKLFTNYLGFKYLLRELCNLDLVSLQAV